MATNLFNVISPGVLEWFFIDINLPDTAADIQRSVGFVKFSIQPLQTIAPGTVIENNAAIVFDNNLPVITNTVFNTILGEPLTISPNGPATFCSGDSVILTASSANSYLWSTGDTSQSITVTAAGDYSVIDASECLATSDTVTVTEDLANVLPGTYTVDITDANGCVFASNFTVPGVGCQCDLTVGTYCYSTVQSITGNVVWDVTTSHPNCGVTSYVTVNNIIFVLPGATLTIEPDVTVAFGPLGRIVLLRSGLAAIPGGIMNLDNCTLTGAGTCMWPGVQVHGAGWLGNSNSAHARLNMFNGAIIEHAEIGVFCGCENLTTICNTSYGGGRVNVQSSVLRNNNRSIYFDQYYYPSSSAIQSSEFVCDAQLRDPSLDVSGDGRSTNFIQLLQIGGVDIIGNTFHNTGVGASANSTTAINGYDAQELYIDNNTINFCSRGITLQHPGVSSTMHFIQGNTIENIRPANGWDIDVVNGSSDEILNNPQLSGTQGMPNYGIIMANSGNYSISGNANIGNHLYGIVNVNSGLSSKVCKNTIDLSNTSMLMSGSNPNLNLVCNEMSNYDRAWWVLGTLPSQIIGGAAGGNLFNDLGSAVDICSNTGFTYYFNAIPAQAEPDNNTGNISFSCAGTSPVTTTNVAGSQTSYCAGVPCTIYTLTEILANYDSAQTCEEKAKWGKELIEYYMENGQEQDAFTFLQSFIGQNVNPLTCANNQIVVCHVPPGNPGNAHSLCISTNALQAHLNHGDYIGACAQDCFDSIMAIQAIYMLVPQYIEDSLFADASNLLALLPLSDQEQQAFFQYYQILIGLFSQDLTYYDIDSLQTTEFIDIANTCTRTATRAQAVLRRLYGMTFPLFWDQCGTELSQMRIAGDMSEEGKQVQKGPTVEVEKEALNTAPELQVYPNPNKGTFNINLTGTSGNNTCSISIYDRLGGLVYKEEQVTDLSHFVDLSRNSRGVYFVKVSCGDDILFDKIILQ